MTTVLGTFNCGIGVEVSDYILCLRKNVSSPHKNGLSIVGGPSFREPRGNYCAGMKGYVINRNSVDECAGILCYEQKS